MGNKVLKIKNCFELKCPKLWDDLKKTNDKDVKFCNSCKKNVYKTTSFGELFQLARDGKCVAYFDELYSHKKAEMSNATLGFLKPSDFWKHRNAKRFIE